MARPSGMLFTAIATAIKQSEPGSVAESGSYAHALRGRVHGHDAHDERAVRASAPCNAPIVRSRRRAASVRATATKAAPDNAPSAVRAGLHSPPWRSRLTLAPSMTPAASAFAGASQRCVAPRPKANGRAPRPVATAVPKAATTTRRLSATPRTGYDRRPADSIEIEIQVERRCEQERRRPDVDRVKLRILPVSEHVGNKPHDEPHERHGSVHLSLVTELRRCPRARIGGNTH